MKRNTFMRIFAIALVAMSIMAVTIPAFALSGSYKPYLGGDTSSYYIRRGHTGTQVKNLQRLLNEYLDFNLTVDGIFGSVTEDAVEALQSIIYGDGANEIDGIVGPETKYELWHRCSNMPSGMVVVYPQFQ